MVIVSWSPLLFWAGAELFFKNRLWDELCSECLGSEPFLIDSERVDVLSYFSLALSGSQSLNEWNGMDG